MQQTINKSPDKRRGKLLTIIQNSIRGFRKLKVNSRNSFKIKFGKNAYIGPKADFFVPEFCKIGSNVSIGGEALVQANLIIGDESLISSRVSFVGADHDLNLNVNSAYASGRLPPSTIVLEGNNFIGYGATLLGNITIGKGAVIGACSLVIRDVPENAVVAGVPAKIIKQREEL